MTSLIKSAIATAALSIGALSLQSPALAQYSDARAVPTYESAGLYWSSPAVANALTGCEVKFRKAGASTWSQGYPMWLDVRNGECRGSLVHLAAGTAYEAQLNVPGQPVARTLSFTTWANQKPIAKTVTVASGSGTLNITEGGTASGYVVYQGAPGAVLDANNNAQFNVSVNASYVIVRGLKLLNAKQDAIRIAPNLTDVIIEDNEITGWGRLRTGSWGMDMDSAVRAICSSPTLTRVTIQRNQIHDPRYGTNSWSDGHPTGPQAVTLSFCGGNHVIRHNEIFSAPGHYFNDIIGGEDNQSTTGFPNSDTDIYGNELSHAWDDAIEAEGGNNNVRIWGNYMDQTGTGVASSITSVGPLYIFRNVWNRGRILEKTPLDQDDRQAMFKAGSNPAFGDGRRYLFHNTMLQATGSGATYTLGGSTGPSGNGGGNVLNNTVSRNNIYHTWRNWTAVYDLGVNNDFANDMHSGPYGGTVVNGIQASPSYAPGNGWQSESGGQYALAAGTPGYDQAMRLANFNESFVNSAPDVGAAEAGAGPMRFGIAASPGPAAAGATASPPPAPPSPTSPAPATGNEMPRLQGLSTRMQVRTGNDVMIGGFIVGNGSNKTVIVRARGPSLAASGISNPLANPTLQLVRASDQATIATNDDWGTATNVAEIIASGYAPASALESAILINLSPGAYTAIVSGVGGGAGVGIVEVYELDMPSVPLEGISTRGQVLSGNDVMIGGFVIGGTSSKTVVVRARGPSLVSGGVANALPNPMLQLVRASDQATIASNDDWGSSSNAAAITASGFAPSDSREAAILVTLAPGAYTAIVSGAGGATGVGIVEVFAL